MGRSVAGRVYELVMEGLRRCRLKAATTDSTAFVEDPLRVSVNRDPHKIVKMTPTGDDATLCRYGEVLYVSLVNHYAEFLGPSEYEYYSLDRVVRNADIRWVDCLMLWARRMSREGPLTMVDGLDVFEGLFGEFLRQRPRETYEKLKALADDPKTRIVFVGGLAAVPDFVEAPVPSELVPDIVGFVESGMDWIEDEVIKLAAAAKGLPVAEGMRVLDVLSAQVREEWNDARNEIGFSRAALTKQVT